MNTTCLVHSFFLPTHGPCCIDTHPPSFINTIEVMTFFLSLLFFFLYAFTFLWLNLIVPTTFDCFTLKITTFCFRIMKSLRTHEATASASDDFNAWIESTTSKVCATPDMKEYVASLYIRERYPKLSLDESLQLLSNQHFINKLASDNVPGHAQGYLLATRTSLRLKSLYEKGHVKLASAKQKMKRKYPVILTRMSMRQNPIYASSWKSSSPNEVCDLLQPQFGFAHEEGHTSPPGYTSWDGRGELGDCSFNYNELIANRTRLDSPVDSLKLNKIHYYGRKSSSVDLNEHKSGSSGLYGEWDWSRLREQQVERLRQFQREFGFQFYYSREASPQTEEANTNSLGDTPFNSYHTAREARGRRNSPETPADIMNLFAVPR